MLLQGIQVRYYRVSDSNDRGYELHVRWNPEEEEWVNNGVYFYAQDLRRYIYTALHLATGYERFHKDAIEALSAR